MVSIKFYYTKNFTELKTDTSSRKAVSKGDFSIEGISSKFL